MAQLFLRPTYKMGWALCALGLLLAMRPGYHFLRRHWLHWQVTSQWQQRNPKAAAFSGDPVAWLRSDPAGLDTPVLYDASPKHLRNFPCISNQGVLPGDSGLTIILGHRDAHFRELGQLTYGDKVFVENLQGRRLVYGVSTIEIMDIAEMEARLRDPPPFQGMVLSTCYPFVYVGPAPQRYLVWLREIP